MSDNQIGKFTLAATGDVLLHESVYQEAKCQSGYNFDPMFSRVKHLFKKEHLIIVNQESLIAGKEIGLSGFPRFNSPIEIGYTLKELNVDIVNLANNHVLDHGEKGIIKSIDNWEKIGIPYVGAYKSKIDQETLRVFHKNGLKVCFLSYTQSLGLGKRPPNKPYLANKFSDMNVKWIKRLITRIRRESIADIVILSMHYGKEYLRLPSSYQQEVSTELSDAGADVIIGHHPHVLQPPAIIENSKGLNTFVAYSLGNFFSGQLGIYRQIGAYLTVDIEKCLASPYHRVDFKNPTLYLTFVDTKGKKRFNMHLLKDLVKEREYIVTNHGTFKSIKVYEEMKRSEEHTS